MRPWLSAGHRKKLNKTNAYRASGGIVLPERRPPESTGSEILYSRHSVKKSDSLGTYERKLRYILLCKCPADKLTKFSNFVRLYPKT